MIFQKTLSKLSFIFPLATIAVALPSFAGTVIGTVEVLAPDELVAGKTQAQWGDLWWQWALGIPKTQNPLVFDDNTDPLGEEGYNQKAQINQPESVFFIAGFAGQSQNPVERSITVPANQYIFFPLINQALENVSVTDDPTDPNFFGNLPVDSGDADGTDIFEDCFGTNPTNNPPSLRDCTASIINSTTDLFATINGVDTESQIDLFQYRQKSLIPFSFTIPVDNFVGYPDPLFLNNPGNFQKLSLPTTVSPVVSDGYWLALAPLNPGEYTIKFGGDNFLTSQNITYKITAIPVPENYSSLSLIGIVSLGAMNAIKRKKR